MSEFTHLDPNGRPHMVDVSEKADTRREATARGEVVMQPATLAAIAQGQIAKGDVLATAQVAAVMAAKRTWEIVPLCHPLLLNGVSVAIELNQPANTVEISATVKTTGKTGVEMEALTAVSAAALTIYDMCKAIDPGMRITNVRLIRKSGGKSGEVILETDAGVGAGD
ncbi:MAG TPA: cyclic pyranopterin monophosphate synthase MoaC [Chloroflexota bacterium]|nr:cyclic pyranopterin monophosphate synthase MoaC [Chloroflexota bacterium]